MSEDEIETEKPYKVAYIVKKFPHFKRQNQKGQGLKMLTPDQMISRLLISLAKLKAGNNSEKLKNGMRQIYIYRSKKLPKTIYNNLINTVKKMETIFMNTENSKTNKPHRFILALADNLNLKSSEKIWH